MKKSIAVVLLTLVTSLVYSECLYRLMYNNLRWDMNHQEVVNALPSLVLRPVDSVAPYPRTLGVRSGQAFTRQQELGAALLYFNSRTHLLDRVYFLFLSTKDAEHLLSLLDEKFGKSRVVENRPDEFTDVVITFQWQSRTTVAKIEINRSDWVDAHFTPRQ